MPKKEEGNLLCVLRHLLTYPYDFISIFIFNIDVILKKIFFKSFTFLWRTLKLISTTRLTNANSIVYTPGKPTVHHHSALKYNHSAISTVSPPPLPPVVNMQIASCDIHSLTTLQVMPVSCHVTLTFSSLSLHSAENHYTFQEASHWLLWFRFTFMNHCFRLWYYFPCMPTSFVTSAFFFRK